MQHFDMESTVFERGGSLLYISVKKIFFTFFTFFPILAYISFSVIGNMVLFIRTDTYGDLSTCFLKLRICFFPDFFHCFILVSIPGYFSVLKKIGKKSSNSSFFSSQNYPSHLPFVVLFCCWYLYNTL